MKSVKSILIVLTLLLTFSLLPGISQFQTSAKENNPKIVFDELTHDFGKVSQGTVLEYIFKFKNEGSGKLIITSVNASCGCTGAVLEGKKEFEEGESGEIKVTFNTQGREGPQTKSVIVQSNDPANTRLILTFNCEIIKNQ